MMSRPGDRRIESAAACDVFLAVIGAPRTYLDCSVAVPSTQKHPNIQLKGIKENQFSQNYGSSLEINRLPAGVSKVFDLKHVGIEKSGSLRHTPFECCKERGIVECPF